MTNDEMASSEMRKWKEEEERKHIEENVMLTDASEKKIATVSIAHDDIPKPIESKEESEPPSSKEAPAPPETPTKTVVIHTELDKAREEQIAALLKQIPAAPPTPPKDKEKEKEKEKGGGGGGEESGREESAFRVESKAVSASPAGKEPAKERRSLPVKLNAESEIAIAMPESTPIHFLSTVIQSPSDVEVGAVLLDATVPVIGRMNVSACDAYWTSCKDNPSYDVVWWRLELAASSSEFPFEEPPIVEPI